MWRLIAGYSLLVLSVLIGLVGGLLVLVNLAGLLWLAEGRWLSGALCYGLATVLLSGLSWAGGQAVLKPKTHGFTARGVAELRAVYRREGLAEHAGGDVGDYGGKTRRELMEVYRRIDRQRVPERFEQLMAAIKAAVEAADGETPAEDAETQAEAAADAADADAEGAEAAGAEGAEGAAVDGHGDIAG